MRIAIITGEYPPMEGGVGDYTRELSHALMEQGHHVDILTSHYNSEFIPNRDKINVCYAIKSWSVRKAFPSIGRWLREISPDIVNIQYQAAAYQMKGAINFLPKWLSINRQPPTIVTYHDLLPPYLFPKAGALRIWSVRYLALQADGIIVTNTEDKDNLTQSLGPDCPSLNVIPIGSNIATQPSEGYQPFKWRTEHGLLENDLLIGFFGFMNRNKGVDVLVSAIASLYHAGLPIKLLFIGGRTGTSDNTNSEYADFIDTLIDEKGINSIVLKTGFIPPDEVSAALLTIDICVLPYLEGVSLRHGTLHAALAHGCAIITTNPPHAIPQLENASLHFIQPNDSVTLAQAIVDLWKNHGYRLSLQKEARALSQQFGWDHIAAQTVSFFRQCLDKNSKF